MKKIFYFCVTASLLLSSCKPIQYHPYFSQTAYTSSDVNIITYSGPYKNSKDWERWHNEVTDLMAKKCPNYVLLKQYSNEKGGGSGTIRNSDGSYSNYTNTTKTYYHFEFKCGGSSYDAPQNEGYVKFRESGEENMKKNNYSQALVEFNKVIELNPNDAMGYYDRARAKSALGDTIGSITDCSKAIELKPTFSMAYNNRGWEKFKQKNYIEALKDFNKAIEIEPRNAIALDSRQETKFALNDFIGCLDDCNSAITLNPKLANSYFFRGKVYFKNGDKIKACENWSKAGQFGKMEAYDLIKQNCN